MPLSDCLGLTLSETRAILKTGGWQLCNYFFTGPWRPVAGKEGEGRVVRFRMVGGNQVELVLAYVDIAEPPAKGGVRTDAP